MVEVINHSFLGKFMPEIFELTLTWLLRFFNYGQVQKTKGCVGGL